MSNQEYAGPLTSDYLENLIKIQYKCLGSSDTWKIFGGGSISEGKDDRELRCPGNTRMSGIQTYQNSGTMIENFKIQCTHMVDQ